MRKKVLIATKNQGKLREIKKFLSDLPLEFISLSDLNITQKVEEDGKTYEENSKKKSLFFAKLSNLPTIADDGGIEIDYLNGAPGVISKRYFGKDGKEATDTQIINQMVKIAHEMPDNNREACFKVVETFALPNGKTWSVHAQIRGVIAKNPNMEYVKGYPYRSFFYLPKLKKFYHESELSEDEQIMYNHRYKAITKLKKIIIDVMLN